MPLDMDAKRKSDSSLREILNTVFQAHGACGDCVSEDISEGFTCILLDQGFQEQCKEGIIGQLGERNLRTV